jgi:hypothetical protein
METEIHLILIIIFSSIYSFGMNLTNNLTKTSNK